jgi:hypothetical protein
LKELNCFSKELAKGEWLLKKIQPSLKKQILDALHDIDFNGFFLKGRGSFVTTLRDFLVSL